jgi:hypothetical protein
VDYNVDNDDDDGYDDDKVDEEKDGIDEMDDDGSDHHIGDYNTISSIEATP